MSGPQQQAQSQAPHQNPIEALQNKLTACQKQLETLYTNREAARSARMTAQTDLTNAIDDNAAKAAKAKDPKNKEATTPTNLTPLRTKVSQANTAVNTAESAYLKKVSEIVGIEDDIRAEENEED